MPAKILSVVLLTFVILSLGALLAFGDSPAPGNTPALTPQPSQAQVTPQAPAVNYEFVEGGQYTTSTCAATLRVYVSSIPSTWPAWYDPAGNATDYKTGSGACSNFIMIVNRSANGMVVSVDYPFYILNQNRAGGQYRVTFLGFTAYFNISQVPTPTPTATPVYTDSVSGKVIDNRGRPLAGAQIAAIAPAWVKRSFGGTGDLAGVDCPTATTCFAVGKGGIILGSRNGGATWAMQAFVTIDDLQDVSCPTATTCFAVGWNGTTLGTTDSGTTWSHQTSDASFLLSISCPTVSTCFAVGANLLAMTTDGGTTWTSRSQFEEVYSISCPTSTSCFVVGFGDKVAITTDGGTTWSSQSSGTGVTYFDQIRCPTATTCFAVGVKSGQPAPFVATTTNGGATWSSQMLPLPSTAGPEGLSCPTATTCVIIGTNGQTHTTTDGGATWQIDPTFNTNPYAIKGLSCPTATFCVAVGAHGTIGTHLPVKLYEAIIDAAGNYALTHLAPNTYTLAVTQGEHTFTPATRSVTVPPSATGQDFVGDFAQPTLYLPLILNAMGGQ